MATANPLQAQTLAELTNGTSWGENSEELLRHFGRAATALPRPLDFGDSYVDVVLRHVPLGGYGVIAYFQMDKATGRLKRIQLERPRHGVNPPVFRAAAAALEATYGAPDRLCGVRPGPASGYQEAAERIWVRDDRVIRAIFRDTTIEAFEGCIGTVGPCGLTGQLLVRISPLGTDEADCPIPPRRPNG
ncbi:MAG TPA: hypothetical protein VHU15_09565 [Stellaceae bacterium]|nr:hypothetical protein [Stellaceae bacterium]